jgi:hypothetical protein
MKTYGGIKFRIKLCPPSRPAVFTPGESTPRTYWIGAGLTPDPILKLWNREKSKVALSLMSYPSIWLGKLRKH